MKNIDDILADFLSRYPLHADEETRLREWTARSPENGKLLASLTSLTGDFAAHRIFEAEKEDISRFIRKEALRRQRNRKMRLVGSAAAVLLFIGISTLIHTRAFMPGSPPSIPPTAEIPGKIELLLPDGRKIALTNGKEQLLFTDSLFMVVDQNNQQLYSSGGEEIEYGELIVPVAAEYNLLLSDGTRVFLNSNTTFRFPKSFGSGKREVFLTGEAYFDVAPDSTRQFVVHSGAMAVYVTGTSFNVKSYPRREKMATTLVSGSVDVFFHDRHYPLSPGEQIVCDTTSNTVAVNRVNTELYTSWKEGFYLFEDLPLEEIMETLSTWYNLEVCFNHEEARRIRFTGRIKRYEEINYLLEKIGRMDEVTVRITGTRIEIGKK